MPEPTATPNNPNPERRCAICGVRTRSRSGICLGCSHTGGTWVEPTEADALRGGRWVSGGGIQRWRPWTETECAERTRRALEGPVDNHFQRPVALRRDTAGSGTEPQIERVA